MPEPPSAPEPTLAPAAPPAEADESMIESGEMSMPRKSDGQEPSRMSQLVSCLSPSSAEDSPVSKRDSVSDEVVKRNSLAEIVSDLGNNMRNSIKQLFNPDAEKEAEKEASAESDLVHGMVESAIQNAVKANARKSKSGKK